MLRLLFVMPYVPSLIRVRSYFFLRCLAGRGHRVTLLTLYANPAEKAQADALQPYCEQVRAYPLYAWRSAANLARALPNRDPLQAWYAWQPQLANELARLAPQNGSRAPFDAIHIEHLRGAQYGVYLRSLAGGEQLPVVWDSVDCISLLFRRAALSSASLPKRWMARLEARRTASFESRMIARFPVLVTSPADRAGLLDLAPEAGPPADIRVVPNGVDLEYFCPAPESRRLPDTLVISGKMSYHANITMALYFAREVLPLVWRHRPETRLQLVGKDPPQALKRLARDPRIRVTGAVDDIRPYLQQATLAVAPLVYGAGIQNKVLEAMACATPVVCTPQAVSALPISPGEQAVIAAGPTQMASEILRLLSDTAARRRIGASGRRYVEAQHAPERIAHLLEDIYQTLPSREPYGHLA